MLYSSQLLEAVITTIEEGERKELDMREARIEYGKMLMSGVESFINKATGEILAAEAMDMEDYSVSERKAAVAARRKSSAKKAAKVAVEAAKFEQKAWHKPQKWQYEEAKAPVQDDGCYSHHIAVSYRKCLTESLSVEEIHRKKNFRGAAVDAVEEYLTAEHKLDVIESKVLRKYEEYGTLVEEYKRYKSQEDWGTYDDWDELQEDMDEVVDKIYAIGKKYFDKLIPEYLDLCEYLGYIPNYDVVSTEQWRYF